MTVVGVVGLGIMGSAMAGHLVDAGFEVHGTDVSPHRSTPSCVPAARPLRTSLLWPRSSTW